MDAAAADFSYDDLQAPAVLLFGGDEARRARIAALIGEAGGRVAANEGLSGAAARIAGQAAMAGVVVDARSDGGAELDTLLAGLDLQAATGRMGLVVLTTAGLIDPVAAHLSGAVTDLLVDPPDTEVIEAIGRLLAPRTTLVADSGGETDARLAELREEVGRIARKLAALSGAEAVVRPVTPPPAPMAPRTATPVDGPLVRALIRLRRLRAQHFDAALFADPAWDILLDLAAARIERRAVAISSLCIAAAVPATTALRWITQMTDQKLLVRRPDPDDGRRVFIGLSDTAAAAMEAYLDGAGKVIAPAA